MKSADPNYFLQLLKSNYFWQLSKSNYFWQLLKSNTPTVNKVK